MTTAIPGEDRSDAATEATPPGYQRVAAGIEIDAPIDVVWDVTTDLDSFVAGIDWVHEARWVDDGPHEGAVYVERASPGLREGTYRWTITAFDPPVRAVHRHEGGELDAILEVTLDAIDDDRTRYTQVMDFRALPAFRPLGFVLERTVMKRQMRGDFEDMILPNYKRFAEERYRA